jgi:hypothetical protein
MQIKDVFFKSRSIFRPVKYEISEMRINSRTAYHNINSLY